MLGAADYEHYREATRLIACFLRDYQQFEEVRSSYAEYRQLIDHYRRKYSVRPRLNAVVTGKMNHAINRRLRTFFTEFYFFLEYAERKLKRQYGKDSEQAKNFKQATSEQFDRSFAYRFVYQLRGYAQHINLPINALSLKSGEFDFLEATTRHNLLVEVDRDELLNSGYHWRAQDVRPHLRSLPGKFELNTYIEEMMSCLEKVHLAFVCVGLPDVKRAADQIKELIEPLHNRGGKPCVYLVEGTPEHPVKGKVYNNVSTPISWIPVELSEFISSLPEPEILSHYDGFAPNIRSEG